MLPNRVRAAAPAVASAVGAALITAAVILLPERSAPPQPMSLLSDVTGTAEIAAERAAEAAALAGAEEPEYEYIDRVVIQSKTTDQRLWVRIIVADRAGNEYQKTVRAQLYVAQPTAIMFQPEIPVLPVTNAKMVKTVVAEDPLIKVDRCFDPVPHPSCRWSATSFVTFKVGNQ